MSKDTPPTWMLAAADDRRPQGSGAYLELRKAASRQLHVFAHGGHGLACATSKSRSSGGRRD